MPPTAEKAITYLRRHASHLAKCPAQNVRTKTSICFKLHSIPDQFSRIGVTVGLTLSFVLSPTNLYERFIETHVFTETKRTHLYALCNFSSIALVA